MEVTSIKELEEREICPECQKSNQLSYLCYMFISLTEAVYKCGSETCMYPFRNFKYKKYHENGDPIDEEPQEEAQVAPVTPPLEESFSEEFTIPEQHDFKIPDGKTLSEDFKIPEQFLDEGAEVNADELNAIIAELEGSLPMKSECKDDSMSMIDLDELLFGTDDSNEIMFPKFEDFNFSDDTSTDLSPPQTPEPKISRCFKKLKKKGKLKMKNKLLKQDKVEKMKATKRSKKLLPLNGIKTENKTEDKLKPFPNLNKSKPLDILKTIESLKF